MSNGMPFTPNTEMTAIAIAYRNRQMIADAVAPRVGVGLREFKYLEFDPRETMTEVNTLVGRKSSPNQVEFTADEKTASVEDHGLTDIVPNDDIKNAPEGYNPQNHAVESVTDLIVLGRELRVAKMYGAAASYKHVQSLSANGYKKLSDPDCPIFEMLLELLDKPLMRPNGLTMSQRVATKLRTNKNLIKGYNGSLGDTGMVPWEYIKEAFEIQNINVGQSRVNLAKKGKDIQLSSCWGDFLSATYIDPLANTQNGRMSFALTAQYDSRVSGERPVSAGLRGGVEIMVGESVRELSIAKDCGILLTDVI